MVSLCRNIATALSCFLSSFSSSRTSSLSALVMSLGNGRVSAVIGMRSFWAVSVTDVDSSGVSVVVKGLAVSEGEDSVRCRSRTCDGTSDPDPVGVVGEESTELLLSYVCCLCVGMDLLTTVVRDLGLGGFMLVLELEGTGSEL